MFMDGEVVCAEKLRLRADHACSAVLAKRMRPDTLDVMEETIEDRMAASCCTQ
jgi:hypothetical protein